MKKVLESRVMDDYAGVGEGYHQKSVYRAEDGENTEEVWLSRSHYSNKLNCPALLTNLSGIVLELSL